MNIRNYIRRRMSDGFFITEFICIEYCGIYINFFFEDMYFLVFLVSENRWKKLKVRLFF